MQPFRFRLETLLKYRRIQEEQQQIKLGQATATYLAEKELLSNWENQLEGHLKFVRNQLQAPSTVAELKMLQQYHDKLNGEIFRQRGRVAEADAYRQECIKALEEAARQRKLVEKLREKRWLQYQADVVFEEQKFLDELGVQAFSRSN